MKLSRKQPPKVQLIDVTSLVSPSLPIPGELSQPTALVDVDIGANWPGSTASIEIFMSTRPIENDPFIIQTIPLNV